MSNMLGKYAIIKNQKYNNKIEIDYNKLTGFKLNPQNKIPYEGIMVNQVVLINQTFIEKILKKKIKRKLDQYLNLIIATLDETGENEGEALRHALNDLSRYRDIVEYKYQKYLDQKYISLLLQKIALLEYELKQKLIYGVEEKTMSGGRSR